MESTPISIVTTADGSITLYNSKIDEHYHSINGALQESMHVFVKSGLSYYHHLNNSQKLSVLEIGFGTGLNFLLSAEYAHLNKLSIDYVGIEAFPLTVNNIEETNYSTHLNNIQIWNNFIKKYSETFESKEEIEGGISLELFDIPLLQYESEMKFDIIYFDAFAKSKQAEMWTAESISHACKFLKDMGIFVTYSVTGDLKRTLKSLGFEIQRPEGAAGKREMMRATFIQKNAL